MSPANQPGPSARVIGALARLVEMPTVSNRPLLELAGHLAERAEDAGFEVERFAAEGGKCTVVARIGPRRGDGSGLVVSGHMDVVPTEGQPWTSDPFRLVERDGRLFGRGSADMKGFLAVVGEALTRIPKTAWTRECVLVWTHDEEIGCKGSAALAEAWRSHPERPALPTACWIGEPTDLAILRMHPGHVAAELEFPGKAAHSSRPDLGHNAIVDAARAVVAIDGLARELEDERADLPEMARPWVPINVARVEGGVAVNVVPDRCRLELGYRPLPGQDPHAVWHRIRGCCGPTATGRVLRVTPAMLTPAGTPLEGLLRPHARHPGTGAATFATDGGNLARLGLQPLVFGPGSIEVAHQADEYVPAADLVAAVDLAEDVLRRACCR